jgi:hypothetical protein
MVRADLVAPIRRERDAVRQEQDLGHQPSPREISGPSRLARERQALPHGNLERVLRAVRIGVALLRAGRGPLA